MAEMPSKQELDDLRSDGYTREEIAELFDVSLSQVKRWIAALGCEKIQARKSGVKRLKVSSGTALPEDYGMTLIERAQRILGVRLVYKKGTGYFVDGRLSTTNDVLIAAGLSPAF